MRSLALDYGVAHTTVLDYVARPEVASEIKQMEKQMRAEQRAVVDRRADERRLEQEVRKKAKEQAARERREERHATAAREVGSRPRRPRSRYGTWLDERDARQPLTRADLHSQNDDIAAAVVTEGGGIQEVLEATDLRTLENVTNLIDPAILKRAYDTDLIRGQRRPS